MGTVHSFSSLIAFEFGYAVVSFAELIHKTFSLDRNYGQPSGWLFWALKSVGQQLPAYCFVSHLLLANLSVQDSRYHCQTLKLPCIF